MANNQIINYRISEDGTWYVLVGISSNPAAGQPGSNAFKIKGAIQLYSTERGISQPIEGHGKSTPGNQAKRTSQASHGAHFAEVGVNAVTGEVRVRRMLGVFDVGRVLNRATAANQIVGGMVWGISYALGEAGVVDTRSGRWINPDFGEYHVAVHADVPDIEVHFIEEVDDAANQVGAKGVGELGISGAGAAVINAIHNATGVRVYDVPATLDKLLAGLPPV